MWFAQRGPKIRELMSVLVTVRLNPGLRRAPKMLRCTKWTIHWHSYIGKTVELNHVGSDACRDDLAGSSASNDYV